MILTGQSSMKNLRESAGNILGQTLIPVMIAVIYITKMILLTILGRGIKFVGTALMIMVENFVKYVLDKSYICYKKYNSK